MTGQPVAPAPLGGGAVHDGLGLALEATDHRVVGSPTVARLVVGHVSRLFGGVTNRVELRLQLVAFRRHRLELSFQLRLGGQQLTVVSLELLVRGLERVGPLRTAHQLVPLGGHVGQLAIGLRFLPLRLSGVTVSSSDLVAHGLDLDPLGAGVRVSLICTLLSSGQLLGLSRVGAGLLLSERTDDGVAVALDAVAEPLEEVGGGVGRVDRVVVSARRLVGELDETGVSATNLGRVALGGGGPKAVAVVLHGVDEVDFGQKLGHSRVS